MERAGRESDGSSTLFLAAIYFGIDDNRKVELEMRAWNAVDHDDPMAALHRDDYVQLTVSWFL